MSAIRYEQAVYGSFPFWDKGYALLAHSPGCRPEWLNEFQQACQRFGQPPPGWDGEGAFFAIRMKSGPWAVVGVGMSGADDRGRPDALSFHGLFVSSRDMRALPRGPFSLEAAIRRQWGPETALSSGSWTGDAATPSEVGSPPLPSEPAGGNPGEVPQKIAEAIDAGARIVIESAVPLDARQLLGVWLRVNTRKRRHLSFATLAFSNANPFDLAAYPNLAVLELDGTEVTQEALAKAPPRPKKQLGVRSWVIAMAAAAAGLAVLVGFVLMRLQRDRPQLETKLSASLPSSVPPPPPRDSKSWPDDPETRARVAEGLLDLAERFGVAGDLAPTDATDPGALMIKLTTRLRYDGPRLTDAERAQLRQRHDSEAERVLAWDDHLRHFAGQRVLPRDFPTRDVASQLEAIAWFFDVSVHPKMSAVEVPFALGEALAVPVSAQPSPLASEYPALTEYSRFLARLPRR